MIQYPTEVPLTEIKDVIATIQSRSFATNGKQFAKDVWTISGFALEKSVGEVPTSFGAIQSSGQVSLSDDEAVQHLQKIVECCEDQHEQGSHVVGAFPAGMLSAIPWKQLLHWALSQLLTLTA